MIYFKNDYIEGCAEEILNELNKTNFEKSVGYGEDEYTKKAIGLIKKEIGNSEVDVHFLVGGTQTNLCAISILKPYEAVICVDSGHINVHECGAIEHSGHAIRTIENINGKIDIKKLVELLDNTSSFHMVKPKMVYISNSTELGTIYSKKELIKLREVCDKYNLYLYIDGARLGSALTSKSNDLTLKDINRYADMFYIGGTKNGALFGEALVISNPEIKPYFKYIMKQNGAILAKGRLLGIQFKQLFTDNLFYRLAKHENEVALKLKEVFIKHGIKFYIESDTNQQFVYFPKEKYLKIEDKVACEIQKEEGEYYIVRFVTSFSSKFEDVEAFDAILTQLD